MCRVRVVSRAWSWFIGAHDTAAGLRLASDGATDRPMTSLLATLVDSCSPGEALARSGALLERVRDGHAHLTAAVVEGAATVLGARQRAGRVVDLDACRARGETVLRRITTGPTITLPSRSIVWSLALPHVAALMPDAHLATLLNRNVRLLLKGLLAAGAQAAYFGRDHIAVGHRPAVALGYEVTRDGRVLLEAFAGVDGVTSRATKSVKDPVSLFACIADTWTPSALARRVNEGAAERSGATLVWEAPDVVAPFEEVSDPMDPLPAESVLEAVVAVPIGCVEGASGPWFGGDALTATWWLDALAAAVRDGSELPAPPVLEGARVDDLLATISAR
jgi:hypothetical protein